MRKKASASSGAQTKAAYSIYASRNSPHGWVEYQLKDFYTHKVDGTWTREKDLKAGAARMRAVNYGKGRSGRWGLSLTDTAIAFLNLAFSTLLTLLCSHNLLATPHS